MFLREEYVGKFWSWKIVRLIASIISFWNFFLSSSSMNFLTGKELVVQ